MPALLAIGAIAAVVLLLVGIFGQAPDPGTALPTGTTTSSTTAATSTPPATTTTPPATTTTPPATTAPPTIPATTVLVLNSTDVSGLAGRVTDYLDGLGWPVTTPDNFLTTLEVTTVYYPEGQEAVAMMLAAAVPGDADTISPAIPEVDPEIFTVVLGNDAVDWLAPGETSPPPT